MNRVLALSLSCFLLGCSEKVFFESSPSVDVSVLKKVYAFLPRVDSTNNSLFENSIMDETIQRIITAKMSERGYVISTRAPELLIKFHVMVENKEDIVNTPIYSYPIGPGFGFPFPYYYYPGPISLGGNTRYIKYEEGKLVIDFIEHSSGKLAWRAWSVGKLDNATNYINELPHLIGRMFIHYPVPVKK
jgi:hypothetical protein